MSFRNTFPSSLLFKKFNQFGARLRAAFSLRGALLPSKLICSVYFLPKKHILCEFYYDRCTFEGSSRRSQKFNSKRGTHTFSLIRWPSCSSNNISSKFHSNRPSCRSDCARVSRSRRVTTSPCSIRPIFNRVRG